MSVTPITPALFSIDEAAVYLRSSRSVVYAEISDGKIKVTMVRGEQRISRGECDAYIKRNTIRRKRGKAA